jgi:hypothetical protein
MTVAETVIRKVLDLPVEQQAKVRKYVESVERENPALSDPYGVAAHLPDRLSLEDFKQNRREMWGTSTDRELDREPK